MLDVEAIKLGPYQKGPVMFIREFRSVNVVVTGCNEGNVVFWDVVRRDVLSGFSV